MKIFEMTDKIYTSRQNCGGKRKSLLKTTNYLSHFKNSLQNFLDNFIIKIRKFIRFTQKNRFFIRNNRVFQTFVQSDGAILIEFAVAMPVLIILIMYIHDLALMKRYYDQVEFIALQMVNMIQNVSQKRANKAITANDLRYTLCAAYLTIYPGTTMYYQTSLNLMGYFGHVPWAHIYYVKGNANGTASCVWRLEVATWTDGSTKITRPDLAWYLRGSGDHWGSVVRWNVNVSLSRIYPTLTINPGEVKIIIDAILLRNTNQKNADGKYSHREVFGFYLITPKGIISSQYAYFFNSVVIFSPKPGLFSETPPS